MKPEIKPSSPQPADNELESALRSLANETHPRPAYKSALRAEIVETGAKQAKRTRKLSWPRPNWAHLQWVRPWMAQVGLVLLLVGLVAAAGMLVPRPLIEATPQPGEPGDQPGQPVALQGQPVSLPTPLPDQPVGQLPAGALSRLGRGTILSLDTAPDGRLAVGSNAGICVYDIGMAPIWCEWTADGVANAQFDPSGEYLALTLSRGTVQVRSAADGTVQAQRQFAGEPSTEDMLSSYALPGASLAWDPSGTQRLAVSAQYRTRTAWEWPTDSIIWGPVSTEEETTDLVWEQNVLIGTERSSVVVLDPNTGAILQRWDDLGSGEPAGVMGSALSPDGQKMAVSVPGSVIEIDLRSDSVGQPVYLNGFMPTRLAYSPDSNRLAIISNETLYISSTDGQTETEMYPIHPLSPLAWAPDKSLYYALPEGVLGKVQDGVSQFMIGEYTSSQQFAAWGNFNEITGIGDRANYTWDAVTGKLNRVSTPQIGEGFYVPAGLTEDGSLALYFQPGSSQVIVWNVAENAAEATLDADSNIQAAAITADGRWAYAITRAGTITTWNRQDSWLRRELAGSLPEDAQIDALAWQPVDGVLLAVSWRKGEESQLELWNMDSGMRVGSTPLVETVSKLVFSPDGTLLAGAQADSIRFWDPNSLELMHSLDPESYANPQGETLTTGGPITALAFSPDGLTLAGGGQAVTLWSIETGLPIGGFYGQGGQVLALAYRYDGSALASSSIDGTITVWDTGAGSLGLPTLPEIPEPTATPMPVPTGAPVEPAYPAPTFDPESAGMTVYTIDSPYGGWQAEIARDDRDYNRITLTDTTSNRQWVFEEWGKGLYSGFTWSSENHFLYFYERHSPDGCTSPIFSYLRRISTETGEVESVPPFGPGQYGYFSLNSNALRMAFVANGMLEIHPLDGGEPYQIPFLPPGEVADPRSGASIPVWSPSNERLFFLWITPFSGCGEEKTEAVYLADVNGRTVQLLEIPPGYTVAGWMPDGWLKLTGSDRQGLYRWNPDGGEPVLLPTGSGEEARQALSQFLNLLATIEQDVDNPVLAVKLYGGDWTALAREMGIDASHTGTLLQKACSDGGYLCRRPREIRSVQMDPALPGHFFQVSFMDDQGNPLTVNGKSEFDFKVVLDENYDWKVMNLPPKEAAP